jgi:hypothetical protein
LAREFKEIKLTHLGREGNHYADALVTLASMARIDFGHKVQSVHINIRNNPAHYCSVEREIDGNPWYYDIKNFIQSGSLLWQRASLSGGSFFSNEGVQPAGWV